MSLLDIFGQRRVFSDSPGKRSAPPQVVAAPRYAEHPTHRVDWEFGGRSVGTNALIPVGLLQPIPKCRLGRLKLFGEFENLFPEFL